MTLARFTINIHVRWAPKADTAALGLWVFRLYFDETVHTALVVHA